MHTNALILSVTTAAVAFTGWAMAQTNSPVELKRHDAEAYGAYITDQEGRTLYLFTADKKGKADNEAKSACYDACAKAWPPLTVHDEPKVGDQLEQDQLGKFLRETGEVQVTYGGWPLYYFVQDQEPGVVNGQDKHGFGGEWYLVSPDGSKNKQEKQQ